MKLKKPVCKTLVSGIVMACLAGGAGAQESLDRGKTPPSYSPPIVRFVTNRRVD
jgi:hypothetical protein